VEQNDKDREAHMRRMQQEAEAERNKAKERTGVDRDIEKELQTVRPGSDAPSRAGISPTGTGADNERG
jgi:hypothetical protein